MPGGPLAAFIYVPIMLLAGVYFSESRAWRLVFSVALIVWLAFAIVLPVVHRNWLRLIFPALVIMFWIFMSEIKRMFKD